MVIIEDKFSVLLSSSLVNFKNLTFITFIEIDHKKLIVKGLKVNKKFNQNEIYKKTSFRFLCEK